LGNLCTTRGVGVPSPGFAPEIPRSSELLPLPPNTAHPECERSERIEGAVSTKRYKADRPLDTLAALALGVSGIWEEAFTPLGKDFGRNVCGCFAPHCV